MSVNSVRNLTFFMVSLVEITNDSYDGIQIDTRKRHISLPAGSLTAQVYCLAYYNSNVGSRAAAPNFRPKEMILKGMIPKGPDKLTQLGLSYPSCSPGTQRRGSLPKRPYRKKVVRWRLGGGGMVTVVVAAC